VNTDVIYLDHAAATPLDERVLHSMAPYFTTSFYNPSSPYSPAINVRRDYEEAKHTIAKQIGAKPDELVITAGATESINLAFGSISGHVITAAIEHQSVLAAAKSHDHTIVTVDHRGYVDPESIRSAIRSDTQLISIALANNELGTIQPLRDIAQIVRQVREDRLAAGDLTPLYFHSDASQGVGQLDVNVARLGLDMVTINAAKIYGPKQVGLLWAASHVVLSPQIVGGGQERGLRSGTENVAGTIGFAKAIELATAHRNFESDRLRTLRDGLQSKLAGAFPKAVFSGHEKHRLAGHLHVSFPNIDGERLLFSLENRGVLVATGSACAANKGTRSHVLTAIGLEPEVADGSIRISLGHLSNPENIEQAGTILIEEVRKEYERTAR
jgi:cysteine desulfurase